MTISLRLDDDARLGAFSCTMLHFEVRGKDDAEETSRRIVDAGRRLHPSRDFGGSANALVIRTESGRRELPMSYLIALGQVAGRLVREAKARRPKRPSATIWATYESGSPATAHQAHGDKTVPGGTRATRTCADPPGTEPGNGT